MISSYYGRKSPKANKARERIETNETETTNNTQGASNSILLGEFGQPRTQQVGSKGLGPESVECGGARGCDTLKRTKNVLDRWPPDPGGPHTKGNH